MTVAPTVFSTAAVLIGTSQIATATVLPMTYGTLPTNRTREDAEVVKLIPQDQVQTCTVEPSMDAPVPQIQ